MKEVNATSNETLSPVSFNSLKNTADKVPEKEYVPFVGEHRYPFIIKDKLSAGGYSSNDRIYCTAVNKHWGLLNGNDYVFHTADGFILKKLERFNDKEKQLTLVSPGNKDERTVILFDDVKAVYFIEEHLRSPNRDR